MTYTGIQVVYNQPGGKTDPQTETTRMVTKVMLKPEDDITKNAVIIIWFCCPGVRAKLFCFDVTEEEIEEDLEPVKKFRCFLPCCYKPKPIYRASSRDFKALENPEESCCRCFGWEEIKRTSPAEPDSFMEFAVNYQKAADIPLIEVTKTGSKDSVTANDDANIQPDYHEGFMTAKEDIYKYENFPELFNEKVHERIGIVTVNGLQGTGFRVGEDLIMTTYNLFGNSSGVINVAKIFSEIRPSITQGLCLSHLPWHKGNVVVDWICLFYDTSRNELWFLYLAFVDNQYETHELYNRHCQTDLGCKNTVWFPR
ncbi:hypothetical protein KUTeg_015451 [Tegillarca granosa]|uniref:Uncharacterized protein n=1 Tax=Tegillarca granosa TaxID=220873 RepID=A0ABQ9ETS6_TEGGR|nr:hypothetical protein KUTeg_015451 [Tegillarca granosa]